MVDLAKTCNARLHALEEHAQLEQLDACMDYSRLSDPTPLVHLHRTLVRRGPLTLVTLNDKGKVLKVRKKQEKRRKRKEGEEKKEGGGERGGGEGREGEGGREEKMKINASTAANHFVTPCYLPLLPLPFFFFAFFFFSYSSCPFFFLSCSF